MLNQADAAEILGVSERTFRRWRDEAEGAEGLYDRRLSRASAHRAGADDVAQVLELFDTRYWTSTPDTFTRSSLPATVSGAVTTESG